MELGMLPGLRPHRGLVWGNWSWPESPAHLLREYVPTLNSPLTLSCIFNSCHMVKQPKYPGRKRESGGNMATNAFLITAVTKSGELFISTSSPNTVGSMRSVTPSRGRHLSFGRGGYPTVSSPSCQDTSGDPWEGSVVRCGGGKGSVFLVDF